MLSRKTSLLLSVIMLNIRHCFEVGTRVVITALNEASYSSETVGSGGFELV